MEILLLFLLIFAILLYFRVTQDPLWKELRKKK
jgi:hypothetical protein